MTEARGSGREDQPHVQGAVAARVQEDMGYFHFGTFMNNATVNICVSFCVYMYFHSLWGIYLGRIVIAGS